MNLVAITGHVEISVIPVNTLQQNLAVPKGLRWCQDRSQVFHMGVSTLKSSVAILYAVMLSCSHDSCVMKFLHEVKYKILVSHPAAL